jgi:glycosyltransferase involved in cell wall biosynthesis
MVTHSFYLSDNRVMRYAKALAARGDEVDVVSLRPSPELPPTQVVDGVRVIRLQDRFSKKERSKAAYLLPLLRFLFKASAWVTRSHAQRPYDLLHIHNVPDFMVFAACYPKLTGKPIILDIHDIVPEFFASKFQLPLKGIFFSLLGRMERWSAAFADHVIIANHLWREKFARRTRSENKCTVFINHVDSEVFRPRPKRAPDGKAIILFPGGLQWHQGVDIAIEAFARVRQQLPNTEFHIYGDGNAKPDLLALAQQLDLNGSVRFFDTITADEVARVMEEADLGVVPKRADSFGNEAYSTKIMEFMSVGVPVIISETRIDRHYFDDSVVRFFESGNPDALAQQILNLLRDPDSARSQLANGLAYAAENSWDSHKERYLNLVDFILAPEC